MKIFLIFFHASFLLISLSTEKKLKNVSTVSSSKKIPLQDAIETLEEVVKEEKIVYDFCHKHFSQRFEFSIDNSFTVPVAVTTQGPRRLSSCGELFNAGYRVSGVHEIHLKNNLSVEKDLAVYCDMETDGGGWTVFQRRNKNAGIPSKVKFFRNWNDYYQGFGSLSDEFWLGNENIHLLSSQEDVSLRVDLKDYDGNKVFAEYEVFGVANERNQYRLKVGGYSGTAGDSMGNHNRETFNTYDRDTHGCARQYNGGWWFVGWIGCHQSMLNGDHDHHLYSLDWLHWTNRSSKIRWTEMKMRPKNFKILNK